MDKLPTLSPLDMAARAQSAKQESSLHQVKALQNRKLNSEAEVEKAAGGFEALLLHQMLKSMWATVQTTGMFGEDSHSSKIYQDMLNQAIADSVAEGQGIGVKDYLRKELLKYADDASK